MAAFVCIISSIFSQNDIQFNPFSESDTSSKYSLWMLGRPPWCTSIPLQPCCLDSHELVLKTHWQNICALRNSTDVARLTYSRFSPPAVRHALLVCHLNLISPSCASSSCSAIRSGAVKQLSDGLVLVYSSDVANPPVSPDFHGWFFKQCVQFMFHAPSPLLTPP